MEHSDSKIPRHVGVIIDGNRRFAKRLMMKPWQGHEWGAKKFERLLEWSMELGIKELTLYAFSLENFNRPKEEFDYLMNIFKEECKRLLKDERIDKNKIKVNFIGRISLFNPELQDLMKQIMDRSKDYHDYTVNFAMAYSGRAEIIDATKKIAQQIKEGKLDIESINEEVFKKNVYLESEPDLIIRTSGEQRLSGFLLWQGSYAEIYWCNKLWPEFEKEDFLAAIEDYSKRQRRFGK